MYFVMTTVFIRPVQMTEKSYYISKPLRDPLVINSFIIANEKDERIIPKKNCAGGNICEKRILSYRAEPIEAKRRSSSSSFSPFFLLYFLLQQIEHGRGKELAQSDFKGVAQFLNRYGTGILAFPIQDAFYGGLRNGG